MKITVACPVSISSEIEKHTDTFLKKTKHNEFDIVFLSAEDENENKNKEKEEKHYFELWTRFICNRYDNLPDFILLLSDDPIKHSTFKNMTELFDKLADQTDVFLDKTQWLVNLKCNDLGYPHHPDLPIKSSFIKLFSSTDPVPELFDFVLGGQSFISKRRILRRPKSFYVSLLQKLQNKEIDRFTMERLWNYL